MTAMNERSDSQPLGRVEIDRLIVALDRHATAAELPTARRLARSLRRGEPLHDGMALARRCLKAEGNDPALLRRLGPSPF